MKKNILSLIILATVAVMATAQHETMRAFTAGGTTTDNSYGVFGQPFGDIVATTDYEVSVGVAQMQLVRDTVYAVVDESMLDGSYTANGVTINPVQGSKKDSAYVVNGGIYNYDVVHYLYLWMCERMIDLSNIEYNTVALDDYCWTKENLRTEHGTPMTYTSEQYPNVNIEKYGYLYTLADAQGLCPTGWSLPDETAMGLLMGHDATTIRSTTDWNTQEVNNNSTRFTAYPAGEFSAMANRFQGMGTQTDWWSTIRTSNSRAISLQVNYYCNVPMLKEHDVNDALSVRCVMKPGDPEWTSLDAAENSSDNPTGNNSDNPTVNP